MMPFKERLSDQEILALAKICPDLRQGPQAGDGQARRRPAPRRQKPEHRNSPVTHVPAPHAAVDRIPLPFSLVRTSVVRPMAQLNVALIGYAFMGRAHSNAYRQVGRFFTPKHPPRMKVLCGRTPDAVKTAADQLGWEETSTDWHEVIHRKDIDIVDVATPGDSHAEIAIAAAKAGKVVFCEKPLANTVAEAEKMLAAVKKAGVIHMLCHNYRRAPAVMLAKELIEKGKLGKLYHFRGTYLQDWIVDPNFPLVWRLRKEAAGSGALGDIASHSLDLARFLVGEITEVTAALETFIKERPLPDNPKKKGAVTVDDASAAVGAIRQWRARDDRGEPLRDWPEELQSLRDQRQQRVDRVQSRAAERARGLPIERRSRRPGLSQRDGDRRASTIRTSDTGGRRATSSATSTRSCTRCTTCSKPSPRARCRRPTSRTACGTRKCSRQWRKPRPRRSG